jgi:hypothetical protein
MERAPRARAQNREKARANATPKTKPVDPRAKVAADRAGEQEREPVAVRDKAGERDRDAEGNPKSPAAAGGYIMLQSQRGGLLATPYFIMFHGRISSRDDAGAPAN